MRASAAACIVLLLSLAARICAGPFATPEPISKDWIIANSAVLNREIDAHTFGFIGGLTRSGTSLVKYLLDVHPNISTMHNTHFPEDEGYNVQTVIPNTHGFTRLKEYRTSMLSEINRLRIYAEWRRFWDVGRPVLVDKSPGNALKMRFLQALFGPTRTFFVMTIRHPAAVFKMYYGRDSDCLKPLIKTWIGTMETVFEDIQKVHTGIVVPFERFVLGDTHAILNKLLARLGLPPSPSIRKISGIKARRDLHGDRKDMSVDMSFAYSSWVDAYREMASASPGACAKVEQDMETTIRKFGYSLIDLYFFEPTQTTRPYLIVHT